MNRISIPTAFDTLTWKHDRATTSRLILNRMRSRKWLNDSLTTRPISLLNCGRLTVRYVEAKYPAICAVELDELK